MQTYIKLTPHFLENLQNILDLFKKVLFLFKKILILFKKNLFFSQANDVYSAQILILSKKHLFFKWFLSKNVWSITFFPSTNLQPYTFWEKFSHAHVNEFDDWRAPSHCKTIGLIFRKWVCMGRPKWLINSGLDCIFLQVGLRKKDLVMDGLWDWQLSLYFG